MKSILPILFFFTCGSFFTKKDMGMPEINNVTKKYSYLALGDSYTIGESVATADNFPNKVVKLINNDSIHFEPTRIIAKTGWTTDELEKGIVAANAAEPLHATYDFVSLLIGVNNQYRGRTVANYTTEFEALLKKAIHFAGDKKDHVVVVSIPDWGVTPFATGRDRIAIATEIDAYNAVNKEIAAKYGVEYINITAWTREAANDNSLLAPDGLHPSGKEYERWAKLIAIFFKSKI